MKAESGTCKSSSSDPILAPSDSNSVAMMRIMNPGEGLGNETSVFKDLPGFVELDHVEGLTPFRQKSIGEAGKRMSFH